MRCTTHNSSFVRAKLQAAWHRISSILSVPASPPSAAASASQPRRLHRFEPQHFSSLSELRASANSGAREIFMIGCSDQGPALEDLSFAPPDSMLIQQNLAASIPSAGNHDDVTSLATVEYAVALAHARHIIVCGHTACQVIPYWLKSTARAHNACPYYLQFEREVRQVVDREYGSRISATERLRLMLEEQTLFQLENLQALTCVQQRLATGELHLHAWLVDDATARIKTYLPQSGQFVPIEEASTTPPVPCHH